MREWLKRLRKERGLTQEDVASKSFINRAFYAQIENGTRNPSFEVARNIASTLGVSSSVFFTNELSAPFEIALKNSDMVIAHCDLELRYTWLFNPHPDFDTTESLSKRDDELATNQGIVDLMALKQEVIDKGIKIKRKICFPLSDGEHCYFVFGEPLLNENKEIIGAVTASMDINDFN
ncbi:helix-turn-helix domain-containing protein [Bacillus luteolus]|uniref:Helix-turn-helix domain-containing protein n=1 Tax=Litchfieldia luteola TaxID=682179 RepID=A0ABR9QKS8_9BACI|nr:helix-turn-helix domain-containing protein [Cytobacillus luteolus]MBE4909102.1 helix-turn-helix domain-containing protein [Cytobacillus luteolus]MBP1940448.1 transcriptional regulator with XRE-family HTH domain [Cytobacillus luteolus]